jgi:hypothetical protein
MRGRLLIIAVCVALVTVPAISQDVRNTYIAVAAQIADGVLTNAKLANMATTTIKGQIVGGSGAPVDLTAAQAAAVIGSVGGALKSKLVAVTRDMTAATASVAYTGFGFQPTVCFAAGQTAGSLTGNVDVFSMVDSSRSASNTVLAANTLNVGTNFLTFIDTTGTNQQTSSVTSFDADGLTLSWTKVGSPTGTASINILCLR